jgi:hypothetical protein
MRRHYARSLQLSSAMAVFALGIIVSAIPLSAQPLAEQLKVGAVASGLGRTQVGLGVKQSPAPFDGSVQPLPEELIGDPIAYSVDPDTLEALKQSPRRVSGLPVIGKEDPDAADEGLVTKALNLTVGFQGLGFANSWPPDNGFAAGPNHLLEAVNFRWQILNKSGVPLTNLINFCGSGGWWTPVLPSGTILCTDPRVLYDQYSDRWILLTVAIDNANQRAWYLISTSFSSDPTGSWCLAALDSTVDGSNLTSNWADFPGLGVDSQAIYITSNQVPFGGNSAGYSKLRILGKSQFYNNTCGSISWRDYWGMHNPDGSSTFTLQPAHTYGSSSVEYLLTLNGTGGNTITMWSLTNPLSSSPTLTSVSASIQSFNVAPNAEQCTNATPINTLDSRLAATVYSNGRLSTSHTVACPTDSTKSCIQALEVNPSGPTVTFDSFFGSSAAGWNYFYPATIEDPAGNMYMVFGRSRANSDTSDGCAELRGTGKLVSEAQIENSFQLKSGAAGYVLLDSFSRNRWGDYNSIALDPADSSSIWVSGDYTSSPNLWGTWIARMQFSQTTSCYALTTNHTGSGSDPSASPANSSGCSSGQYTAGASIQVTASPSSGWNVGSWSGTVNNGSTSTVNSVTMPAGSQTVTVNYVQAPPTCYALTRTHTGSGSDPSASPTNSSGCSSGQYTAGASIQVTASPSSGWNVGSWSGTVNNGSTSTVNSVTMPAGSQTVTVNYVQAPPTCYALTRTHTGSGSDPSASPTNSSGCSSGQYTAGASIQVTASPSSGWNVGSWSGTTNDGSTSTVNTVTMPATNQTVTVNYVQSGSSSILLVDDDDNNPDVRSYYTAALDALGKPYQLWDTANSDNEPGNVALQAYQTVIWFTGASYSAVTGPGASGEADLTSFLSGGNGRCLVLSSQDYHAARGTTGFMTGYLGLGSVLDDVGQSTVQGQGSAFSGLGPYALSYPFFDYSDQILPAAGAEIAFSGDQGGAAISRVGPNHRTIFLAFPFEALPTSQARQDVMAAALDYCATIFADVPPKYWARKFIEAIYRAGVTNGCAQNPLQYCPEVVVTRGSMAQMLIAAKSGPTYVPPPCTSNPFSDVAASDPICPWVQELVHRGVTAGCGGGQYCPNNPVTRSQMSVFLLATWHGAGYAPTPCSGSAFNDVPAISPFCPWIREMANSGITAGCGGGNFCTESPNTRAQLAVFLATTFHLQ